MGCQLSEYRFLGLAEYCGREGNSSEGWRRRVGDGHTIKVWMDPWLPRSYAFKVLSQPSVDQSSLPTMETVSDLIDEDMHCWKEDVIRTIFIQDDADTRWCY